MKKGACVFAVFLAAVFLSTASFPQGEGVTITINSIPATAEEFTALRNETATTPEGGAAMFLVAMIAFVERGDIGMQFFTLSLDMDNLVPGGTYKGYSPNGVKYTYHFNNINAKKYIPFSYVLGTSQGGGYAATLPYKFKFTRNKYSQIADDRVKVFVQCTGADSPRPVTMKKNVNGIWKVYESSTLFMNIKAPIVPQKDDL